MYKYEALNVLLFLIPGFIAATIMNLFVVRKEKKELGKVVEALIFSMVIYTIYSFISGKSPISLLKVNETIAFSYDSKSFLLLLLLSAGIPIILSVFVTNDWHMKLARKLHITQKTSRSSVWLDVFYDIKRPIIINFEDERRIYGWPHYFSDDPEKPYIFLYKPAWIEEDEFINIDAIGILITPEQKIDSIEFL